ncbi:NADH dehydrogenase ubiquinone Fe-S protein 4 [Aureimonas mangrovi]|uniref:NADH dehydrogenase ubiquinone Fe-S protein 4 n=1 Tax=Aureimonas mangrovi TaxID=2758041 RepID=UPI001FE722A5|nr:NADH dehydrogenase ubiquinone Fe-S protein 4 [Aureimonas mangrovi]
MDSFTHVHETTKPHVPHATPSNDNRHTPLSLVRRAFPDGAVARIFKPSRAVTTSGKARTKGWRLVFERLTAPFIEPLMGYTGGDDTLTQIELRFPTLKSAVRYAERQGLAYVIQTAGAQGRSGGSERAGGTPARSGGSTPAFCDATLERLGLSDLQERYGRALNGAANRNDPSGPESWPTPMAVVRDPALTLEAKRSLLMNWAWTEYLMDQATSEGMPENGRPTRLGEVEQALLTLEREAADRNDSGTRMAA